MAQSLVGSKTNRKKSLLQARMEFVAYQCALWLFRTLPLTIAYRLSEWLILGVYTVFPSLNRRIRNHLELSFGKSKSPSDLKRLHRESLRYHAWFWVDMLIGARLVNDPRYFAQIDTSEAANALERCGVGQTGIILVGSHQGSPDLISLALGKMGFPVAAVARTLDNPYILKSIQKDRAQTKRIEIPKTGALRPAFRQLKDNGIIGIQVDQDAGPRGAFIPFFGKLASTHTGPGMLATLAKCPVIAIYAIRTKPRSFSYKLFAHILNPPPKSENIDNTVLAWTRLMTEDIEIMALQFPEQVLWAHRRWKTRPPGEIDSQRSKQALGHPEPSRHAPLGSADRAT